MARRSSTSSSERDVGRAANEDDSPLTSVRAAAGRSRAMPRALMFAIAIVLFVEIVVSNSGWPHTWPYDIGRMEYFVAAAEIERHGAAEVSIVGSSRTRESLIVPLMAKRLSSHLDRPVHVASYAESGAYTTDFEAVTDRLLTSRSKPKVILVGISERDLIYAGKIWDEVATFRHFDNFPEAWQERGSEALAELPVIVRMAVGRYWRTLGLREFIRFKIVDMATGHLGKSEVSPAQGGLTVWQRSSPTRSLAKQPVAKSRVLERSAKFRFDKFPDAQLEDALRDMLISCKDAGVPVVFYEVHRSQALRDALPKGFNRRFTELVSKIAADYGDRFVRLDQLDLKLDDNDMREPSHMSVQGATKLTEALADQVVTPLLGGPTKAKKKRPAMTAATQVSP